MNITVNRKAGKKVHMTVDGEKLVAHTGFPRQYEFSDGRSFTVVGGEVFRDSDREWVEGVGSFYYPPATEAEVGLIAEIHGFVNDLIR